MNTIGIALVWCVLQVTLIGVLAAGLYLMVRRLGPSAAASVMLTCLAIVVVLSFLALSPWPRWTMIHRSALAEGPQLSVAGPDNALIATDVPSVPDDGSVVTNDGNQLVPVKSRPSVFTLL